jgi:hypothetical protein
MIAKNIGKSYQKRWKEKLKRKTETQSKQMCYRFASKAIRVLSGHSGCVHSVGK